MNENVTGLKSESDERELASSTNRQDVALFEIRNAGRIFGGTDGVHIEELDIPAGKMIAILGESGSGKSTLLNLLGNLVRGESGKAAKNEASLKFQTLRNRRWKKGPAELHSQELMPRNILVRVWNEIREYLPWPSSTLIRKETGYVFQEAYLLKNATVSANMALPMRLRGIWSWFVNSLRIEHIAGKLDKDDSDDGSSISGKLSKRSWQLSGGQAQRVAVGRAIAKNPSLILADEPTASLDPDLGVRIMAMLRKWQRAGTQEEPRTVIWATHTMEHAASFADKIIILKRGQLIDLPASEEFRDKYGHSWPIDNPRDHKLIKQLLRGNAQKLPVASQQNIDEHVQRDQQVVEDAPDLSQEEANRPGLFAFGVLWRLGISEIFNHVNVDKGRGPRFLKRLVSVTEPGKEEQQDRVPAFFRKFPGAAILALTGVALIAFGWFSEYGQDFSFGQKVQILFNGVHGVGVSAKSALLTACPQCNAWFPAMDSLPPWAGRVAIIVGLLCLIYLLVRPYVRSIGRKFEFLTYFLILLFLAGAIKGSGVIDSVFKARFKSPELGNTVIEARLFHRKLNVRNIEQLDATLESLGFTPPEMTVVEPGSGDQESPRFTFGRYEKVNVTIGRLPQGWSFKKKKRTPGWGEESEDEPAAAPGQKKCSTRRNEREGELLAIDMREPMVRALPFLAGSRLSDLRKTSYARQEQKDSDGIWGVYLTRKMLRRLGFKMDEEGARGKEIDHFFCMNLYGEKIVRLAGIIERLPNDSSSDYQILIDKGFYRASYQDNHGKKRTSLDKVTLYIDPDQPSRFIDAVQCASSAMRGPSAGCSADLVKKITDHLDYAFRVEGGFDKIRQAISLGDFFKRVSDGILAAFLVLAALLTLKISTSYIMQNERSLCVMRAFGASVWQVLYLVLLQFILILLPGLLFGAVLVYYIWPVVGEPVALLLNVGKETVLFSIDDGLTILFFIGGALLSGCLLAVFGWWAGSRWVAERLKQVG